MADAYYLEHINGMAFILPQMPYQKILSICKDAEFLFQTRGMQDEEKGYLLNIYIFSLFLPPTYCTHKLPEPADSG